MEAFSLLKYWRGGGGGGVAADIGVNGGCAANISKPMAGEVATFVTTAAAQNRTTESTDDDDENDDDDGPFFDLEFSVNDDDDEEDEEGEDGEEIQKCDEEEDAEEDDEDEEEREFKFMLSAGSSNVDRCTEITNYSTDPVSLSPSDDLFFKGKLVPIETSSLLFTTSTSSSSSDQPNSSKPQFPVSLLKSATKFRVFMSGLKKSKSNNVNSSTEKSNSLSNGNGSSSSSSSSSGKEETKKQKNQQGKFFTVKFKVEEVPIVSLFTRDNSSRVSSSSSANKPQKQSSDNDSSSSSSSSSASSSSSSEEKRFAKEVMQRYLKMVKPLYVRVSRRYGEKLRFAGHLSLNNTLSKSPSPPKPAASAAVSASSPAPAEKGGTEAAEVISEAPASINSTKSLKQVNLPAGLRVVCKHLGKSRSASAGAVAVAPPPPGTASSKRRDDSLLQQQDGIQSAILHCKRSFNAIRDSEASSLSRSASDPSRKSSEVAKA